MPLPIALLLQSVFADLLRDEERQPIRPAPYRADDGDCPPLMDAAGSRFDPRLTCDKIRPFCGYVEFSLGAAVVDRVNATMLTAEVILTSASQRTVAKFLSGMNGLTAAFWLPGGYGQRPIGGVPVLMARVPRPGAVYESCGDPETALATESSDLCLMQIGRAVWSMPSGSYPSPQSPPTRDRYQNALDRKAPLLQPIFGAVLGTLGAGIPKVARHSLDAFLVSMPDRTGTIGVVSRHRSGEDVPPITPDGEPLDLGPYYPWGEAGSVVWNAYGAIVAVVNCYFTVADVGIVFRCTRIDFWADWIASVMQDWFGPGGAIPPGPDHPPGTPPPGPEPPRPGGGSSGTTRPVPSVVAGLGLLAGGSVGLVAAGRRRRG